MSRPKRILATGIVTLLAILLLWAFWNYYMRSPWTRDGRVRVEIVNVAPEISGKVLKLFVADNQQVKKGDALFVIDPSDYHYDLERTEALVESSRIAVQLSEQEAKRRNSMPKNAVSVEEVSRYDAIAERDRAAYQQAVAERDQAKLNLERTTVFSPVNGYVTNLHLRIGDYATKGQVQLTVVDSDSFWVAGYFEETKLPRIKPGDAVTMKLMGVSPALRGHVDSISRGIADTNSGVNEVGLSSVDPIFTWVRLAQRIPVRIVIDRRPEGVELAAGQTCTVTVHPGKRW